MPCSICLLIPGYITTRDRCVNADPNYGSAWFHSRHKQHEIPSAVLRNAIDILALELFGAHKIYARAILHYVRTCLQDAHGKGSAKGKDQDQGASASSGKEKAAAVDPSHHHHQQLQQQPAVPSSDRSNNSSSSKMPSQQESMGVAEKELLREKELLQDLELSDSQLGPWPRFEAVRLVPFVSIEHGSVYSCTDFVTGIVEMNRTIFKRDLPTEVRRKNLFGSDQIVS